MNFVFTKRDGTRVHIAYDVEASQEVPIPDGAEVVTVFFGTKQATITAEPPVDEVMRMNLAGFAPELRDRIRAVCEKTLREFNGSPERVFEFREAQRVLRAIRSLE